jgi:hypothetical protein
MAIEREMLAQPAPEAQTALLKRIDAIERSVNELKTPLSFADQLYVLRDHVGMVRQHLLAATQPANQA